MGIFSHDEDPSWSDVIYYEEQVKELKAENERLKLSERDLSRICQGFKKDIETEKTYALKYYKTLQEIKAIAEEWMKDYCYLDNFKDKEGCCICHENKDCYSYRLLKALTKAGEE